MYPRSLDRVWEKTVIARCAKRAVAIQPFDRLTALSEVEALDCFVVPPERDSSQ
jgi:hypothetical protein